MGRSEHGDGQPSVRRARLERVAEKLAMCDNDDVESLLCRASRTEAGIGGTHLTIDVEDTPVFVKRVPLTDLERRDEHVMSTENMFDLPPGCHYGVGSPSFSAWRELAAARMTSRWVLEGRSQGFPLLYHWRVLDSPVGKSAGPFSEQLADVDRFVEYWHGSDAVRRRVEAVNSATASVALFFEHVAVPLPDWLGERTAQGDVDAITTANEQLRRVVLGMNRLGMFHFDAHLGNFVTDGQQLRLVDFGQAASTDFKLSAAERSFLIDNSTHDICHATTRLVDWLVTTLMLPSDWHARDDLVYEAAHDPTVVRDLPGIAAAFITRYAPVAVVVNAFYRRLHLDDRATPYPSEAARQACDECRLQTP
jgi:hypothetical protein